MKIEGLDAELSRLECKDGDVLCLSGPGADMLMERPDMLDELNKSLSEYGLKDFLMLLIPTGSSMKTLNEEEMRKEGWIKEVK